MAKTFPTRAAPLSLLGGSTLAELFHLENSAVCLESIRHFSNVSGLVQQNPKLYVPFAPRFKPKRVVVVGGVFSYFLLSF